MSGGSALLCLAAHGCGPGCDLINPPTSKGQQKGPRYLPVVLAVLQMFFLAALVVYYIVHTLARIVQQTYVTRSLSSQT